MKPLRAYKNLGELALDMFPVFKSPDEVKKQEAMQVQSFVAKLEGKGYGQPFFAPGDVKGKLESHLQKIIAESKVPHVQEKNILKAAFKDMMSDFKLPQKKLYGLSTQIEPTVNNAFKYVNFQLSYDANKGFKIEEMTMAQRHTDSEQTHSRLLSQPRVIPSKDFAIAFINLSLKAPGKELKKVLKQRIV